MTSTVQIAVIHTRRERLRVSSESAISKTGMEQKIQGIAVPKKDAKAHF